MKCLIWKNHVFDIEKIENISIDLKTEIDDEAFNVEWRYIEVKINNTVLKIWPEELGIDEKTATNLWKKWGTIKKNIGEKIANELNAAANSEKYVINLGEILQKVLSP